MMAAGPIAQERETERNREDDMPVSGARPPVVVQLSTVHRSTDVRIRVKECRSLVEAGYDVRLIAAGDEEPGRATDGIDVTPLEAQAGARLKRLTLGLAAAYRQTRRQRPELVHFHDPELLVLAPLFRMGGMKVVYDVHEDLPGQVRTKPHVPRRLRVPLSVLLRVAEPVMARAANAVVVVDPKWASRYRNRTITLRNFPAASEFSGFERTVDLESCDPHFVYVGGIARLRGAIDIVEAANLAGDEGVRCTLGGPIQDGIEPELHRLDRAQAVSLPGWVDRGTVLDLYRSALAGLAILAPIPNYIEAMATKVFEYMHAGLPMILSDIPSHRRLVDEHGCGLLVPYGDPEALAEAMRRLARDRALAAEMGRAALAAGRMYSWEHDVADLVDFYRSAVPTVA